MVTHRIDSVVAVVMFVALVTPAVAQAPCVPAAPLKTQSGKTFGIERGKSYTWRTDYQGSVESWSWWTAGGAQSRDTAMSQAFELWEQADAMNTVNSTFTQVAYNQPADFEVRVYWVERYCQMLWIAA